MGVGHLFKLILAHNSNQQYKPRMKHFLIQLLQQLFNIKMKLT